MRPMYEYGEVFIPPYEIGPPREGNHPIEWLNEVGREGWLLVSVGPSWTLSNPMRTSAIFVRQIEHLVGN